MNLFLYILSFIVSLTVSLNLHGKNTHYSYTQLSLKEGLSQASVQAILLDSKGNLWIGTRNGYYGIINRRVFSHTEVHVSYDTEKDYYECQHGCKYRPAYAKF